MAQNEIAIRFTEDKYATKVEVAKDLKTSNVDPFWNNILSYRSQFNHYLTIKTINRNMFVFCACPSISGRISNVENKLIKVNRESSRLSPFNGDLYRYKDLCIISCSQEIAKKNDIDVSDEFLRSLVHDDVQTFAPNLKPIVNYYNALKYVSKSYSNSVNDEYLGELYCQLMGTNELTSFYRHKDDNNPENRVLIDRIYSAAPHQLIDSMMGYLFNFLATSSLPSTIKALSSYYYINYVKPFDYYSDEIALLIAKSILAHDSLDELGVYLPLETFISEGQEDLSKRYIEVQKTADITYFINYAIKVFEARLDFTLDLLANLNADILKKDFYKEDKKVEQEAPANKPTITIEKPVSESSQVVQKPIETETPKVNVNYVNEELAVSYIPPVLDEKEACRLEQHLLESDPSLRKGEAKFFARHCIKGKKYTIQQYKKALGCAYETARSSMEHLVELGYYRKDMVKNKFVYTPIPR